MRENQDLVMRDPGEGVAPDGTIRTGAKRSRVAAVFEPAVAAVSELATISPGASIYLYGSVATGQAEAGRSDIDILSIGLPSDIARSAGRELSTRFTDLCRSVEISPTRPDDLTGDDDAAYGLRVFLRHYCVHLSGPDRHSKLRRYPADAHAARGFNGDIGRHLAVWREAAQRDDPRVLGRRVARKTLLVAAGLVSVRNSEWTTDRAHAASAYAAYQSQLADDLQLLLRWATDTSVPGLRAVARFLDSRSTIELIVSDFAETIGLWSG